MEVTQILLTGRWVNDFYQHLIVAIFLLYHHFALGCLQSFVGTRARLSYDAFAEYFVTALYALCMSVHAYTYASDNVSSRPALVI